MLAALLLNLTSGPPSPPGGAPSPYGPALFPWERKKWFGDFESPLTKATRRKCAEYLKRVEFGILPPEVKEAIVEKSTTLVLPKAEAYLQGRTRLNPDRIVSAVIREMKSEIRQTLEKRRIFMDEESDVECLTLLSLIEDA